MRYFNYHSKIKSLITGGHCTGASLYDEYHGISPAIVIYFDNHQPMPVREYRFEEYFTLFDKYDIKLRDKIK